MTGILNSSGNEIAAYTYDAWGNLLTTTGTHALTNLNPLRYRGYVYDQETELYYLQSRYYNPEVGRFLNADIYTSTGQGLLGNNMFSYCQNNPVKFSDSSGEFALSAFLGAVIGGAIGGAVISAVSHIVNCGIAGQEVTASGVIGSAITGATIGAIGAAIGTIELSTKAVTTTAKGIASAVVGIGMGIKTGLETSGSVVEKIANGVFTGAVTAGSTFLGSLIPAFDAGYGFGGNLFTNFCTTLFVGTPAETVTVGVQQGAKAIIQSITNSRSAPTLSRSVNPRFDSRISIACAS